MVATKPPTACPRQRRHRPRRRCVVSAAVWLLNLLLLIIIVGLRFQIDGSPRLVSSVSFWFTPTMPANANATTTTTTTTTAATTTTKALRRSERDDRWWWWTHLSGTMSRDGKKDDQGIGRVASPTSGASSSSSMPPRRREQRLGMKRNSKEKKQNSEIQEPNQGQYRDAFASHRGPSSTTAACLMYDDGDDRHLQEWLPYHYHVTNLRHVILRVDPASTTATAAQLSIILDPWRARIRFEVWSDDSFVTADDLRNVQEQVEWYGVPTNNKTIEEYIKIQDIFINRCLKRMKQRSMGWTLILDADEYLRINYQSVESWSENHPATSLILTSPPPMDEPGSVMTFLEQELSKPNKASMPKPLIDSACIQIPRSVFGPVESSSSTRQQKISAIKGVDVKSFETLRFRYHDAPHCPVEDAWEKPFEKFRWGKAMVDLSRISMDELEDIGNKHLPVRHHCSFVRMKCTIPTDHIFVVNHYDFDDDSKSDRRTIKSFEEQYKINATTDDDIRPWLEGFARVHRSEASKALLQPN